MGVIKNCLNKLHNRNFLDENFKLNKDCYLIGLGDYGGRGNKSVQVWNLLLELKIQNPKQVLLMQGNHETETMAKVDGFHGNFHEYFMFDSTDERDKLWNKITKELFPALPQIMFIGQETYSSQLTKLTCFLIFCHGGIALDPTTNKLYDAKPLITTLLNFPFTHETTVYQSLINFSPQNGFIWNDFIPTLDTEQLKNNKSFPSFRYDRPCSLYNVQPYSVLEKYIADTSYTSGPNRFLTTGIIHGHIHTCLNHIGITKLTPKLAADDPRVKQLTQSLENQDLLDETCWFKPSFNGLAPKELLCELCKASGEPFDIAAKVPVAAVTTIATRPNSLGNHDSALLLIDIGIGNKWYATPFSIGGLRSM
jgi:Calcineurin-like phosphoesterase.